MPAFPLSRRLALRLGLAARSLPGVSVRQLVGLLLAKTLRRAGEIGVRRALGATPEQLKWYRRKVQDKGQANIDQEYALDPETCFLVLGRPFFDRGVTAALMAAACDPVTVEQVRREGAVGVAELVRSSCTANGRKHDTHPLWGQA